MPRMSKSERAFRAKYPYARHEVTERRGVLGALPRFTVYAGDYLCAESWQLARAYRNALEAAELGYITPDPDEQAAPVDLDGHQTDPDASGRL